MFSQPAIGTSGRRPDQDPCAPSPCNKGQSKLQVGATCFRIRKAASKIPADLLVFRVTEEETDSPKGEAVTEQGLWTLVLADFYREQREQREQRGRCSSGVRWEETAALRTFSAQERDLTGTPVPGTPGAKPAAPSCPPPEPGPKPDAHLAGEEGKTTLQRVRSRYSLRGFGAHNPIQTARDRHRFSIRPLPAATKLASKPIGHCQQLRANPLLHTRTAAFDWPFRIDLKIKPHQEKGQYRGY